MARPDAHRSQRREDRAKLQDVYVDIETDEPQFATVKEGLISRHLTFVPLGGIVIGPHNLQVTATKEQVRLCPTSRHTERSSPKPTSRPISPLPAQLHPAQHPERPPSRPPLSANR